MKKDYLLSKFSNLFAITSVKLRISNPNKYNAIDQNFT